MTTRKTRGRPSYDDSKAFAAIAAKMVNEKMARGTAMRAILKTGNHAGGASGEAILHRWRAKWPTEGLAAIDAAKNPPNAATSRSATVARDVWLDYAMSNSLTRTMAPYSTAVDETARLVAEQVAHFERFGRPALEAATKALKDAGGISFLMQQTKMAHDAWDDYARDALRKSYRGF